MNAFYLIFIGCMLISCSRPEHKFNDDYVLIEFAAKLEGQYHAPKETQMNASPHEDMQKPYEPPVENEILLEDLENN